MQANQVIEPRRNIKNVIAIMSGKGGVGKSTVTAILAKELKKMGYSVGIMDADITGPSIPRLMDIKDRRSTTDGQYFMPVTTKEGIKVISLNSVLPNEEEAVVWRGPVIASAVMQFWNEVVWDDLDYLLIDMPPGTGDVPLTVMKSIPLKGVIMVSIPQDMVSMIVAKAVNMAKKLKVEVLGLIQNMSYISCNECKHKIYLSDDEDRELIEKMGVELLGELPMTKEIAKLSKGQELYNENLFSHIAKRIVEKIEK
ncbi:Mrp/NBP35 family ATP-binding protein [Fusobacterium russii]|uniref:Mrp/NBP35 family ATP-binding protein n=1 Tax=Fusobacterium russii TaxID=854 RepID=UPI0003A99178|nr:Mrp/NBP35 family ATP-binding protein [Fusobacterium russii]